MDAVSFVTSERPAVDLRPPSAVTWLGRVVSALPLLFLTFDTAIKLWMAPVAVQATTELGFSESAVFVVGVVEAVCLVLYVVPRTSILGAVLWTGYLGGAVATQVRAGSPLITYILVPIYVAVLLWTGLYLRNTGLRRMVRMAFCDFD